MFRGATWLTFDRAHRVVRADLRIGPAGVIEGFVPAGRAARRGEEEIDATGRIGMPGLIQTHVHLCQTLFRGLSERRELLPWLRERIWPLEALHDAGTLRASARLGLTELAMGGTTCILDMGTTRGIESILDAAEASGLRVITGTALMDRGEETPASLLRPADEAIEETLRLRERRSSGGLADLCLAPRFIPSVAHETWLSIARLSRRHGLLVHTHASETRSENRLVRKLTGKTPIGYLRDSGVASPRLCVAHAIWITSDDRAVLRAAGASVCHCPGSNAKLGSGAADVLSMLQSGIRVGIGCDGAACNNRLDLFEELRRAAALVSLRHGPESVDPSAVLDMATRAGAAILGRADQIGSIEPGKQADLLLLAPGRGAGLWNAGAEPHAAVLHGAGVEHVDQVWVGGRRVVDRGRGVMRSWSVRAVTREAARAAESIQQRWEAAWGSRSN